MEVRWKNFKGFKDTGWIKINPVTIILGSNNCGKTSFLAPLLLMNQTINSRDSLSPLILKGDVFDGGNYQEIVKDYDVTKEIFFGLKYSTIKTPDKTKELGHYPPGGFEVTFIQDEKTKELSLKQITIYDIMDRVFLSLKKESNGKFKYTGIGGKSLRKYEREAISNSLPTNFLISPNGVLSELEDVQSRKANNKSPEQFSIGFSH